MVRYRILSLVLGFSAIFIAGCGYHLSGTTDQGQNALKTMILNSQDPYGLLARAVRAELRINDITIVDDTQVKSATLPSLRIESALENQKTASVFQNGKTAEYQMMLSVHAQLCIPGQDYYPIDVMVYRSFFNNSLRTLAKDAEKNILLQEMSQQFAQKLVRQLLSVYAAKKSDSALMSEAPAS